MGLSIHYSGKIAKPEYLPDLVEEVEEIVKVYKWPSYIFERHFPADSFGSTNYNERIYGISFTPGNCETIPFCFLSNGRISDVVHLRLFGKSPKEEERDFLYHLSVKTQFAGIETHRIIIHLFRYINNKYLTDFRMSDESSYWETNNEKLLAANFKKYDSLMESFSSAIINYPIMPGENVESYIQRLIKYISDRKK